MLRKPLLSALAILAFLPAVATAAQAGPEDALSANIPIGTLAACGRAPSGGGCTGAVVGALDAARERLGLGAYELPANFASLSGAKQIFILTNLDRIAYGLPPIAGLSPVIAAAARGAMRSDADPDPTALLASLPSYAWSSNWAGDWANASYAYYEWMYDDGYDGAETSNIDCTSPTATGCWDHRHNLLSFENPGTLALGVTTGVDAHGQSSYTTTLVWTPGGAWTHLSYTWAQAEAHGAGVALTAGARAHHRR
jgi:hypothetical protein